MIIVLSVALALFIILTILTELEHWGWSTLTLIAAVAAAYFTKAVDFRALLTTNLLDVAVYTVGYFVAGVAWSFVKWFSFLYRFRDRYREAREDFKQSIKVDPENYDRELKSWLARRSLDERPTAAKNKSRIVGWMAFWPCSFLGTLINDPVRRIFNALYSGFRRLYERVADHVFRNDPIFK